ncbi:MAG: multidrug efflux pump subunit AcrB, partial [Lysobacterales bacterium]
MSLAKFSVQNSALVNLLSVFIILIGTYSMLTMRRDAFPQVNYDVVTISTVWPGAPAEDIEKFVTIPIEKELKSISGIEEMSSKSNEGLSEIGITIDPGVRDKKKVVDDIERAVDRTNNLPAEVDDPTVFELASREFPIIEISLGGDVNEKMRREYAEELEDLLLDIDGVSQIRKYGWRDPEFWVEVDPKKMSEYYVSMQEVMDALRTRNVTIPGGQLSTDTDEFNVRTTGEFRTAEEIGNVVIRANDLGNWLRVKDVAHIQETFEDEITVSKVNSERATAMVVIKSEQADAITVVKQVREVTAEFEKGLPEGMEILVTNDFSYYIKRRLGVLKNNGIIGFVLVLVILFLFLDPIPAFMTAVGIPIALCMTFFVMSAFDVTINLVSMLGIILVLGMLVDDGIIVAENVFRHVEEGMEPKKAAIVGTNEVIAPVTITILTTFAAFGPLMFMPDIMGKFIREIPIVVMITLTASLIEAFIFLPCHLADCMNYFKGSTHKPKEKIWYVKLKAFYTKCLHVSINKRYLVLIGMGLVFLFAMWVGKTQLKFLLFGGEGIETFFVRAEAKKGTPLDKMSDMMSKVEAVVAELPDAELDDYRTYIGAIQEDEGFDPNAKRGSHLAQITVFLTPMQERDRRPQEIAAALRERLKTVEGFEKLSTFLPKEGPPVGAAVEVGVKGEKWETMKEIANKFVIHLEKQPGVSDVSISYEFGKKQLSVIVDEEKAKKYSLTIDRIASTVRNVFKGGVATSIKPKKAEEEMDVLVRYPKEVRSDKDVFAAILVPNTKGNLVRLDAVAKIEEHEGIYSINHKDGKRIVYVTAQVDNDLATSLTVNQDLQKEFVNVTDGYQGYTVNYSGEFEDQMKSTRNLLMSYLFALFLIFILLVAMFKSIAQPFIIMFAIPFGIVGVILAFWVHDIILPAGRPLNFFAMMGLVGLTGIVVNDSVVLVDFINRARIKGMARRKSIIEAGQKRLRPVIMTSVTTIGGLVSVAYGIGGGDPFLKPMALAIVWGLTFSTVLTLVGIPCLYAIADDILE